MRIKINWPAEIFSRLFFFRIWFQLVSHRYADSAQAASPSGYMAGFDDGITNGAQWYMISGGRQDYMTYFQGGREVTLEIDVNGTKHGIIDAVGPNKFVHLVIEASGKTWRMSGERCHPPPFPY